MNSGSSDERGSADNFSGQICIWYQDQCNEDDGNDEDDEDLVTLQYLEPHEMTGRIWSESQSFDIWSLFWTITKFSELRIFFH